jgi:hypothetical protein
MKLKFGERLIEPAIRRLYDLRDVSFDSAWFEEASDRDAYYMYRDLALTPTDAAAVTSTSSATISRSSLHSIWDSSSSRRTGTTTRA